MIIPRAKVLEARELLGFSSDEELSEKMVVAAYRTASKTAHPDGGGSQEAFARVDWAKHVLTAYIREGMSNDKPTHSPEKCDVCNGKGFTEGARKGFAAPAKRFCQRCSGTGDASFEPDTPTE